MANPSKIFKNHSAWEVTLFFAFCRWLVTGGHVLLPGEYEFTVTPAGTNNATPLQRRVVRVEGQRTQVSLQLPARRLCTVKLVAR